MNLFEALEVYSASIEARDFSTKQRKKLAKTGAALPGGGFPIVNKGDLKNAELAIGRAGNPGAARAHIRQRAKSLHVKLSDTWTKKKKVDAAETISNPSNFNQPTDMGPSRALDPA